MRICVGPTLTSLPAKLHLPALGADVAIALGEIYRWTPLAPAG